jgi:Zn-dependent metalloprotease
LTAVAALIAAAACSNAEPGKLGGIELDAQRAGTPGASQAERWAALAATSARATAVRWNEDASAPAAFYGRFKAGGASEASARGFIERNGALLGLERARGELALIADRSSPLGRHLTFAQVHQGVPVHGASVSLHFDADGQVIGVTNEARDVRVPSSQPQLSAAQAEQIAAAYVHADQGANFDAEDLGAPSSQLVVRASKKGDALAFRVAVPTLAGPTYEVFVDARSGGVLDQPRDLNQYATGRIFNVNAVVATRDTTLTDQRDSASAVPDSAYSLAALQGLKLNGFLDGDYASSADTKKRAFSASNDFLFDRSNDGFSETMGYYYIDYTQRYIQSLGFTKVNNRQLVFSVNKYKGDNSFYSPGTKGITYGTGGVDDAEDAHVIVHEYGHSVQDNILPGFGASSEAGAMGEGFGDYLAGTVGAQLTDFQLECLAEWDATSYSNTNPPCLRRLDSQKVYPKDISNEVHADGEMWSASLWQIHNALGGPRADLAIIQHHYLVSKTASFSEAANALVTTAIGLHFTGAEVNAIRSILKARGFTLTV